MPTQTTANVNFYDSVAHERYLLENVPKRLILEQFAVPKELPANDSKSLEIIEFSAFPEVTTPLSEDTPGNEQALSFTRTTATIQLYGAYIKLSKMLVKTHQENLPAIVVEKFTDQVARTRESLIVSELDTNASVRFYSGTATQRIEVTATIDDALVKKVRNYLIKKRMPRVTKAVNPSNGYSTTPVLPSYVWIIHPDKINDVEALTGFTSYEQYHDRDKTFGLNEIGKAHGFRFIVGDADFMPLYAGAGGGTPAADVYVSIVLAADAFMALKHSAMTLEYHEVGFAADKADPQGQFMSQGWTMTFATKILRSDGVIAVEHA